MNVAILAPKQASTGDTVLHPKPMTRDWLDPAELASLTVEEVLARIDALKPLIGANARQAELVRQPVDELWAAIRRTGVFHLFVRRKFGGMEAGGLQALTDAVTSVGEAADRGEQRRRRDDLARRKRAGVTVPIRMPAMNNVTAASCIAYRQR